MEEKYKILIVDDEQSILDMLKLQLEFEGYSVYTCLLYTSDAADE